jgi:hypothetical protein
VIGGQYGEQVLEGQFGAATNAINGGLECGSSPKNPDGAKKRFHIYEKVLLAFNIDTPADESGCY